MAFWSAKRLFSVRLCGVAARARRVLLGGPRDGAALDRLVRTAERLDYGGGPPATTDRETPRRG
ncbi:hypothetical protein [Actinacidiphila sp. bgisy160]|uniref:hypothetical protein n=1 Tax=Actinacidiphila sp. bgisy160 TaxID=3413796 RepID=UPI003D7201EC